MLVTAEKPRVMPEIFVIATSHIHIHFAPTLMYAIALGSWVKSGHIQRLLGSVEGSNRLCDPLFP